MRYNDLSAAAYAIDPTLFQAEEYPVTIETHSELARGQTVVDRRALGQDFGNESARVRVCLEVDAERLTSLFTQRICAYRPRIPNRNPPAISRDLAQLGYRFLDLVIVRLIARAIAHPLVADDALLVQHENARFAAT